MRNEPALLEAVCREISLKKSLTGAGLLALTTAFGGRLRRALQIVRRGGVRKCRLKPSERIVWLVVGRRSEYEVIPSINFCTCDDFYFNIIDQRGALCCHLIAQKLAEALGKYEQIEAKDEEYRLFEVR